MTPEDRREAFMRGWLEPPATGVHVPDPFTREVAARLPWGYAEVHGWLRELAELSVPPEQARRVLVACALAGLSPTRLIAEHRRVMASTTLDTGTDRSHSDGNSA